jgi:hypothetical protein
MKDDFLFVYVKGDEVKAMTLDDSPEQHESVREDGYNLTATISSRHFLKELISKPKEEQIEMIEGLRHE